MRRKSRKRQPVTANTELTDGEVLALWYDWELWQRPKQAIPPWDWLVWFLSAGRGFGKTRTGAETVRIWIETNKIVHLIGATAGDVRDTMIEGPAGLMNIFPPGQTPKYEPSKRKITFHNGAIGKLFSAEEPDRLRGPQCYKAWCDELAAWTYDQETWDMMMFGLRLGKDPQVVVTTTPRPTKLIRDLIKDPKTHLTNGSTFENADNLATPFLDTIRKKYEGTTLGRQELYAELLTDVEGALWTIKLIDSTRVRECPPHDRIVVAVDPSANDGRDGDECGITGACISGGEGYLIADRSGMYSPEGWAKAAIALYHELSADVLVAEKNNGGEMVRTIIRKIDPSVNVKLVHASKAKRTRAEPIAALYEQGRIHHLGAFSKLEDEMVTWVPGIGMKSPNRIDALVWAFTELMLKPVYTTRRARK